MSGIGEKGGLEVERGQDGYETRVWLSRLSRAVILRGF